MIRKMIGDDFRERVMEKIFKEFAYSINIYEEYKDFGERLDKESVAELGSNCFLIRLGMLL